MALCAAACAGEDAAENAAPPPAAESSAAPAAAAPAAPKAATTAVAGDEAADGGAPDATVAIEFKEADFIESDDSRDPFRSFANIWLRRAKAKIDVQRKVLGSRFALEELKLNGVVTRGSRLAMLVDPNGLGWILRTGDFVGKAEMVSTGGPQGQDVAMNWRVDRIQETDVVFVREDPAHPEIPPATRIMYLHPLEGSEAGEGG
ncbi:MAG: pilus assembly protein PilP [Deltaproteobacteria bacterium]|nr:pilus assembly protein PilP [Deltaproteobacteria bacterium]